MCFKIFFLFVSHSVPSDPSVSVSLPRQICLLKNPLQKASFTSTLMTLPAKRRHLWRRERHPESALSPFALHTSSITFWKPPKGFLVSLSCPVREIFGANSLRNSPLTRNNSKFARSSSMEPDGTITRPLLVNVLILKRTMAKREPILLNSKEIGV